VLRLIVNKPIRNKNMGKTYRHDSDLSFRGKKSKQSKKLKKWEKSNEFKKKTVKDFLEEENDY
jgi:hypothetical protein